MAVKRLTSANGWSERVVGYSSKAQDHATAADSSGRVVRYPPKILSMIHLAILLWLNAHEIATPMNCG